MIERKDVLRWMELHMTMKVHRANEANNGYAAPEMFTPFASSLLRNFSHYKMAGGTKTLEEILAGPE